MSKVCNCLAAVLILSLMATTACGPENDPRYNGWNRYTDDDDHYVILVPPEWIVEGEMMLGMRGVRLFDQRIITPPLTGRLYFSIYVKDIKAEDKTPLDKRARSLVDGLLRGLWCDNEMKSESGKVVDVPAILFDISGHDCASGIGLRGLVAVFEAGNREFILFGTSTTETWHIYEETMNLLIGAFRLQQ
jgi:hypothetical protein